MPDPGARGEEPSYERATSGSFRELFPTDELALYGSGAAVFFVLAVLTRDVVLNWIVGPLFITVWAWYVPLLHARWRARRAGGR